MNKIVQLLIILILIISSFTGILIISPQEVTAEIMQHDPIRIEGDEDFAFHAANESWLGDGTEGNPYIIENYNISTNSGYCIEIERTTVHFVIRNSLFERAGNADTGTFQSWQGGINLDRVTNGKIINCTLENNNNGIDLWDTEEIYITNNTMINNGIRIRGFDLEDLNSHTIDSTNTVNGKPVYYWKNQNTGVIPSGAGQVILVNCTNIIIEGQDINQVSIGIQLVYCDKNTINQNNIISNSYYGIYLDNSYNNTISENTIISNENNGIFLFNSDHNLIINNKISMNNASGILIGQSAGNNITENLVFNNNQYLLKF